MPRLQVKRECNPGVSTSVSSIVQHQNFKRMLMFGLRALSDFCNPTSKIYKENAYDALCRGAVGPIKTAVINYKDDDDVLYCSCKILCAMSDYCISDKDQEALQKLIDEGGIEAIIEIIKSSPSDLDTVKNCMSFIENMNKANVEIKGSELSIGLLNVFISSTHNHKLGKAITASLSVAAKSSCGSKALYDQGGHIKLIEHCMSFQTINDDVASIVESVFDTLKNLASNGYVDQRLIEDSVTILDKFKSYPRVVSKGSEAIKYAVGPEQLTNCLNVLKVSKQGSKEQDSALELLGSLSYISSISDKVVQSGGIPVLIELINSGLQKYDSNPKKISRLVAGASRMLGGIASNPQHAHTVYEYGGVASLCTALSYFPNDPECVKAICYALIPFVSSFKYVSEINEYSLFASLLPILYGSLDSVELAKASMMCIAAASMINEYHKHMVKNQAIEILSTCVQYHLSETDYLLNCFTAYFRLSDCITSVEVIHQYGGVNGIVDALLAVCNISKIVEIGLKLINKMLTASGALKYMSNQHVVDSVLTVMLENENEEVIIREGTKIMEKLATENDCQRHISNLESVINSAQKNPDAAYKTLAAISGLSRIPSLRNILESKKADSSILHGIQVWIELPRFNEQSKLIKAGFKAIALLKLNSSSPISQVIESIVQLMHIPQVKRIAEYEEPGDNILIASAACINNLTKLNKINEAEIVESSLDNIIKLMKKYPESHLTQTQLILAINNVLLSSNKLGVDIFVNKVYIKQIVNYLHKVPMYVDVQIAGFTVLSNIVKITPESIDAIKKTNTIDTLQKALHTHTKNIKLRTICAPLLALLMPLDSLSVEISDLLSLINKGMKEKNIVKVHECLVSLNELLITPEASKISTRCNIGEYIYKIQVWLKENPKVADSVTSNAYDITGRSLYNATVSEVAHSCTSVSQTRIGLVHLTKNDITGSLIDLYSILYSSEEYYTEALSNILEPLSLLMKHDIINADTAFKSGLVKKLCDGIKYFSESDMAIQSAFRCLSCMCTDGKRVNQLINSPEFGELISTIVKLVGNSEKNKDSRLNAIKALNELVRNNRSEIITYVSNNTPAVDNLFKIMKEYQDDLSVVQESSKCLAILADFTSLEKNLKINKTDAIKILLDSLNMNKNDEIAALELMKISVKLFNVNDKFHLKDLGAIDIISDVILIHNNNDEILRLGGILFSYMGADEQVKKLMKLILCVKSDDPDAIHKINNLTSKLEMFLRAPLDNPLDALQYTESTLQVLNGYLASEPDNVSLQTNIALVAKRLVDRVRNNHEDQLGSWAVASAGTLNQFIDMITNKIGHSNSKFVAPVYSVFSDCTANPYTKQLVLDKLPQIISATYETLEMHKNQPEVMAAIFDFLNQIARDEDGVKLVHEHWNGPSGNLIDQILSIMNLHRTNDDVYENGIKLLEAISETASISGFANDMNVEAILKISEALLNSGNSKDRLLGFISLVDHLVLNNLLDEKVGSDALKKIGNLVTEDNLSKYPEEDRNEIMKAYAALINDCCSTGLFLHILPVEKVNTLNNLQKLIEYAQNLEVTAACLEAISAIASCDASLAQKISSSVLPAIIESSHDHILNNLDVTDAFLKVLESLLMNDGIGRQLVDNAELNNILNELNDVLEKNKEELGDDFVNETKLRISNVKTIMNDDIPKEKSCKDVYDLLTQYVTDETPINVLQDPNLEADMNFVLSRLKIYNKDNLAPNTESGIDYSYGHMAIELFSNNEENIIELEKKDYHTIAFHALINQPDEHIKHYACRSLCAFTKTLKGLDAVKKIKDYPNIVSKSVGNLNMEQGLVLENKEDFLKHRVLLIDRTAYSRNIYDKTNAVHNLIETWNDFDKGNYTVLLLRHVFRSMRKIVSDAHVETLLKADVLVRLINIINDPVTDRILYPDVLFLIGSLSIVNEIKTKIGELGGVDACVNLLLRSINLEGLEPTITNCCLTLANMCIDHKPNSTIFCNLKGPDINVRVLREYKSNFSVTNGASVLLCNILFKNENMKKYYGKNGAPLELVQCLKNYDGSDDLNAVRCIESLFKSISNLSLYTANIKFFLDEKIEIAFESWLSKLNESFPDSQLETCLRTLSNLVLENEERNMKNFGVTLIPVLNVLKQKRENTKVIYLLLDILCSLCRLNENAKLFADNNGIDLTINVIQLYDYDISLLSLAIHLLSNQCKIESSLPLLVKSNIFGILISCIEAETDEFEMSELVIGALRCTRRLIQSEELAYEFCNSGGIPSLANSICKSVKQSAVMLELLRVLLCILYYTQNVDNVTNEYPEEQEELYNAKLGGWYNISMDKDMIDVIIQSILTCANDENHQKQLRLQKVTLGLLGYFAYHRLGIISMTASGFDNLVKYNLVNFAGDSVIMQLLCICIDNIAMYSGEIYDTTISRDLIKCFKNGLSKMKYQKEDKNIYQKIQLTLDAMNSSDDPFNAFKDTLLIFDFSLSEFDVDLYVNGTHDLPSNIKDTLRNGSTCKIFHNSSDRQTFKWKASQDLNFIEWVIGDNLENVFKIPIVRIKNISKGLAHPLLKAANKKEPRKVTAKVTFCIFGTPIDEFPNGLELPIKTKTQKERDALVDLIVLWRDASSYNY